MQHRAATLADVDALVALWNARRAVATSCWFGAPEATTDAVVSLLSAADVHLVEHEGQAVGFSFHDGAQLAASCGMDSRAYYYGLVAYARRAIALGHTDGRCQVRADQTDEMGWLNALAVARFEAVGFEPLPPGADLQSPRVPRVYRVTAELAALEAAALAAAEVPAA
jgi:hypothetical protein